MARPKNTDPQYQKEPNAGTVKEAVKDPNLKTRADKVDVGNKASATKPQQVHGHNVNRTGPGGSK